MLGNLLVDEYKKTRTIKDLNGAIKSFRDAVESTPMEHRDRPRRLSNLGVWLSERSSLTSNSKDLEEAIIRSQQAVDTTPLQSCLRAQVLSNLGIRLSERYRQAGHQDDLNEAIRHLRDATSTCAPPSKDVDRAGLYTNPGLLLYHKYNTTQEMDHLDQAVDSCQKAVDATPAGAKVRAKVLTHLGIMLGARYNRTKEPRDLEDAISHSLQAVEEKSDHPDTEACLNNLALHLGAKYDKTRNLGILEETIRYHEKAMEGTSQDHLDYAIWANNLGMRLAEMYERTQSGEDLHVAIQYIGIACDRFPKDSPDRSGILNNLGAQYLVKYHKTGQEQDFESAVSNLTEAVTMKAGLPIERIMEAGLPIERIMAARSLGAAMMDKSRWLEALETYNIAFQVLQTLHLRPLPRADQQWIPGNLSGLSSNAASCILQVKRPASEALRFLEASRCVITGFAIHSRTDVTELRARDQDLCDKYESCRDAISRWGRRYQDAIPHGLDRMNSQDSASLPEKLEELGDIEKRIRRIPDEVEDLKPKRVWWSAGGSAGRLPFHAAGDHSRNSTSNTISRVISSYTSTLKALKYSMEMPGSKASTGQMLLIDMPETPGYDDLNTTHEVAVITSQFGPRVTHLKSCSKSDVMANLSNSTFAHFACHGTSDPHDPAESGLVLLEQGMPALLTIGELDRINMQNAQIAYLSACSTAELSAGQLLDEAIHISNSFQMLGFKHVVGTMWSADDHAAGVVARQFYTQLLRGDEENQDEYQVAQVLHRAIYNFRKTPGVREDVLLWGSFIHIGA
ncbi:CHAT domain-containing protein [Trichoderma pleuroticola]